MAADEYVREKAIARVDVIKVDVEGGEVAVLSGAKNVLSSVQRPVIVLEFSEPALKAAGTSSEELAGLLTFYGYALFRVPGARVYAYNVLAVPKCRAAEILNALDIGDLPLAFEAGTPRS
jgi:hypothetical protein